MQKKTLGYWVICTRSYETNGHEVLKGQMCYYTSRRPIFNTDWRRSTSDEIATRINFKGRSYNLKNV